VVTAAATIVQILVGWIERRTERIAERVVRMVLSTAC
jgi:hypothetical protein